MLIRSMLFIALLLSREKLLAQTIANPRISTKKAVRQIARVGVLKCELVGRAPIVPQQYLRFDLLRKQCTDVELTALLKHRTPIVRAYAFQALSERPGIDLFPLLLQHRQDTTRLATICGCIGSVQAVVDVMFSDYKTSGQYAQDTSMNDRKMYVEIMEEDMEQFRRKRQKYRLASKERRRELIQEAKRFSAQSDE